MSENSATARLAFDMPKLSAEPGRPEPGRAQRDRESEINSENALYLAQLEAHFDTLLANVHLLHSASPLRFSIQTSNQSSARTMPRGDHWCSRTSMRENLERVASFKLQSPSHAGGPRHDSQTTLETVETRAPFPSFTASPAVDPSLSDEDDECPEDMLNLPEMSADSNHLPDSTFRLVWDTVYMLLAFLETSHVVLCTMTVKNGRFTVALNPVLVAIKVFATCFWIVDMAYVQVRTFRVEQYVLVEHPDALREKYLRSWFVADLIGTLPLDLICYYSVSHHVGHIMSILRIIRLVHVPYLFGRLAPKTTPPWQIECAFFLFWVSLFVHASTCVWLACASEEELALSRPTHDDLETAYFTAFYFIISVLTNVGYGDTPPLSIGTKYYIIFLEVAGSVLLIGLGGRAGAYFVTTDPFELLVLERRRRLESLLQRNTIPWVVQRDAFSVYPVILEASLKDYQDIVDQLPQMMQVKIGFHIKRRMLRKVPMFGELPLDVVGKLAWRLIDDYCEPKVYLMRTGDIGSEMYFLVNGVVEVLTEEVDRGEVQETCKATLSDGSWFGEIALLLPQSRRVASVRSVTSCCLYSLVQRDFDKVVAQSPDLRGLLEKHARHRLGELDLGGSVLGTRPPANPEKPPEGEALAVGPELQPCDSIPVIEEEAPSDCGEISFRGIGSASCHGDEVSDASA